MIIVYGSDAAASGGGWDAKLEIRDARTGRGEDRGVAGLWLVEANDAVIDTAPFGERLCGIRDAALRCFVSAI
jgi:hypothetical protein